MTDPTPASDLRAAIDAAGLREAILSQRESFLPSPGLDPAWIAGWHAAIDHVAAKVSAHTPPTEPATENGECTCGKFAGTSVVYADCPVHAPGATPAPAPVAQDAATLTDDERERLTTSLRWHFDVVAEEGKGSPYASTGISNALRIVERILAARQPVATETEGEQA